MAAALRQPDMRLAPTLGPWASATGRPPRAAIQDVAKAGFTSIQLDAAAAGLRPRELDARARRDLAAYLARCGLQPAGLDLFIPPSHFVEARHVDRAMAAVLAAITLAADLGRLPLSLALPVNDLPQDARASLLQAADAHGTRLVVHAEDQMDAVLTWIRAVDLPCLRLGLDPAAALALGDDPVSLAQRHSQLLGVGRLADWRRGGRSDRRRCPVGGGGLDLPAYRLSLELPTSRVGPVVLDLRDLAEPSQAAGAAWEAWRRTTPALP